MSDKDVKCPKCESDVIDLAWIDAADSSVGIEFQQGYCYICNHDWNECSRDET